MDEVRFSFDCDGSRPAECCARRASVVECTGIMGVLQLLFARWSKNVAGEDRPRDFRLERPTGRSCATAAVIS